MPIKMVFWDLGGIIFALDRRSVAEKLAKGSRRYLSDELFALFTYQQGLILDFWETIDRFDEGGFSDYDFYLRIAASLDLDKKLIDFSYFREIWRGLIYLLPETVELAKRLVGVRQGIISNLNRIHQSMIFTMIPRELFDITIFSYVELVRKPNPLIYQRARQAANVKFKEILFIDDKLENLAAATKLGMRVFHFDTKLPVRERVRNLEIYMKKLRIKIRSH